MADPDRGYWGGGAGYWGGLLGYWGAAAGYWGGFIIGVVIPARRQFYKLKGTTRRKWREYFIVEED